MNVFRTILWLGMLILAAGNVFAQTPITWEDLDNVDFDFKYIPEKKTMDSNPTFGPELLALAGQRVEVKGFVIPMKADQKAYALSQYPNASCFFCGNAGLQTIMELRLKKKNASYKTDEFLTFTGTLRLSEDIEELPFVLESAVEK